MILAFVLIAGSLVAAAAVLVLLPLLRRRDDARPAAAITSAVVLFAMLLGGAGLYAAFSNYTWVEAPAVGNSPAAEAAQRAKALAENPDNLGGWLELAKKYTEIGQYPLAIRAYQRADRLANGGNIEAIFGVADLLMAQDTSEIERAAGHLYEKALQLEPDNPKALFYSAFAADVRGETPLARERYQRMQTFNLPPEAQALIAQRLAVIEQQAAQPQQPDSQKPGAGSPAGGPTIAVRVTLAPALAAKVPAGAPLFVAARDPKSPGPPFAVKRLPANFPVDVELTAADAMLASRRISAGQRLEVVARVALGGTPTATSGDPFGQVSYTVGKHGKLNIVIDRLAP
jgi:cytochrome c-type biogenesis protein CcmH